jgi:hypothetical protein
LTETSPVVSLDDEDITVGSIGRLVSNTEAKVRYMYKSQYWSLKLFLEISAL